MASDEPTDGELGDFETESQAPTEGAVDADYDDALKEFEDDVDAAVGNKVRRLHPPDIAVDLVTRQPLFVRRKSAESLDEYYEEQGFNLLTYKGHPYLPVTIDDRVFECVFIPGKPGEIHKDKKTYDYPEGRLARVPIEQAWLNSDEEQFPWSVDFVAAALTAFITNVDMGVGTIDADVLIDRAYDTFGEDVADEVRNRGDF